MGRQRDAGFAGVVFKERGSRKVSNEALVSYKKYEGGDSGIQVEASKHSEALMNSLADMLADVGSKKSSKEASKKGSKKMTGF